MDGTDICRDANKAQFYFPNGCISSTHRKKVRTGSGRGYELSNPAVSYLLPIVRIYHKSFASLHRQSSLLGVKLSNTSSYVIPLIQTTIVSLPPTKMTMTKFFSLCLILLPVHQTIRWHLCELKEKFTNK